MAGVEPPRPGYAAAPAAVWLDTLQRRLGLHRQGPSSAAVRGRVAADGSHAASAAGVAIPAADPGAGPGRPLGASAGRRRMAAGPSSTGRVPAPGRRARGGQQVHRGPPRRVGRAAGPGSAAKSSRLELPASRSSLADSASWTSLSGFGFACSTRPCPACRAAKVCCPTSRWTLRASRRWCYPSQRVFITENETNFLAFPEVADAIVVFGAGYGWEALARASWLHRCQLHYWGDIDTHGFAILDQLRGYFPARRPSSWTGRRSLPTACTGARSPTLRATTWRVSHPRRRRL
jgi:hypothetical protein